MYSRQGEYLSKEWTRSQSASDPRSSNPAARNGPMMCPSCGSFSILSAVINLVAGTDIIDDPFVTIPPVTHSPFPDWGVSNILILGSRVRPIFLPQEWKTEDEETSTSLNSLNSEHVLVSQNAGFARKLSGLKEHATTKPEAVVVVHRDLTRTRILGNRIFLPNLLFRSLVLPFSCAS